MDYNEVIIILKKHGHHKYSNISDYWFDNDRELKNILKKYDPWFYQTFELQVRWKSEIGQACQTAIRLFIETTLENWRLSHKYNPDKSFETPKWPNIEFSGFRFKFNDCEYSIEDFAFKFKTSHTSGWTDLRGIDLSGISIGSCNILNCFFANANFDKANFQQISLFNCNFVKASFVNARLASIRMDKESTFGSANFTNAYLNAIELNYHNFNDITFKKITYYNLLLLLISKLFHIKTKSKFHHNLYLKHTEFQFVFTNDFQNPENKALKRYIDWFMFVNKQVVNFKSLDFLDKFDFVFNLVMTKYWTSFKVLILNTCLIIFIFSFVYYCNIDNLLLNKEITSNYFTTLYYSVSTFSTFGFGDIIHKTNVLQLAIMIEIMLGYFILGIFVILITRKLDAKY